MPTPVNNAPQVPGIQYPRHGENQDPVNKNIYDNLIFLRSILGVSTTIPLPALTAKGKQGSLTFTYGILTSFVAPS